MTDFKTDDEIYWFDCEGDCSGGLLSNNIILKKGRINIVFPERIDVFGNDGYSHKLAFDYVNIFKSKSEAIDAMIKRLEEMKDET